ncbi:MAG: sigma-70 family RNA polymerase sigma factor [Actinobacteria bacterium]|nr:sigma-70 family RNA polymerase sigma factor [Actinomycetota bacterium]
MDVYIRSETMEERELVGMAREGDRDAFGQLFRAHHGAIFRLARATLGDGAEDVTSETFLRAWTALPDYRDTGAPFVAWLYGIARHIVVDELRRRSRTEPRAEIDAGQVEQPHDDRLTLASALDDLPDEQRQILELKFFLGLTNDEVGAALGKTPGAVNTQQWRALQALRKMMPR